MKNIGSYAFTSLSARGFTTLRINYGVESIGSNAFQSCTSVKFVYLPSSIKSMSSNVFVNCPIQTIFAALETMPTITSTTFQSMAVSATGSRYWWAGTTKGLNAANSNTYIKNNFTVQKNTPSGCDATVTMGTNTNNTLTDVYVVVTEPTSNPNYLSADYAGKAKIIGASFRESNSSKTLYINKNYVDIDGVSYYITEIDNSAFEKTTTIKVLDTSESSYLQTIGTYAFHQCTSLTKVVLGNSVKTINNYAFYQCSALTTASVNAETIGDNAFFNCTSLSTLTLGSSVKTLGSRSFAYTAVTTIEDYAFNGTKGSSVRIPSSVTKFGQRALYSLTVDNLILNSRTVPKYLSSYQLDLSGIAPLSPSKVTPTLSVPNGCEANYRANSTWNSTFNTINGWGYDDFAGSRYITVTSNSSYTDTNVQSTAAARQAMVVKGFGTPSGALTLPVSNYFFLPKAALCYAVDYYNQKRDLFFLKYLYTNQGVKGFTGMLMRGTPGTVYRFQTPSEASTTSVTSQTSLLKGIGANGYTYDSQNNFIYRHSGYSNEFISGLGGHTAFGETYLEVPKDADGSYPYSINYGGIISNYNLWVANTRLHNGNYDELNRISGVTGGVEYDPDSKTLTLNNASITTPTLGVYQQMGDLTLVVEGTNTIRTNTTGGDINRGVYVRQFDNLTISGPGTLRVTAEDGIAVEGGSITIDGGVQLTAAGRSVSYNGIGIIHHTNLTISGAATVVNATGDDKSVFCSVADGGTITLNDGIALTAPAGARIKNGSVCAASNTTPIGNAWVKFNKLLYAKGDINGDGSVNSADITALSNYVIGRTTAASLKGDLDVNGDGFINVADVAAIIRIIVGK